MKTYTVKLYGVHKHPVLGDIPLHEISTGIMLVTINSLKKATWYHPSGNLPISEAKIKNLMAAYPLTTIL